MAMAFDFSGFLQEYTDNKAKKVEHRSGRSPNQKMRQLPAYQEFRNWQSQMVAPTSPEATLARDKAIDADTRAAASQYQQNKQMSGGAGEVAGDSQFYTDLSRGATQAKLGARLGEQEDYRNRLGQVAQAKGEEIWRLRNAKEAHRQFMLSRELQTKLMAQQAEMAAAENRGALYGAGIGAAGSILGGAASALGGG